MKDDQGVQQKTMWLSIGGEDMKIRQSTFYAFRILHRLDEAQGRVVTSKEIAEKESLSAGVVLRILRTMSYSGIVDVHQGRGEVCGGFSLEKPIDEITILEVIKMLEGVDICTNIDADSRMKDTLMFLTCSRMNDELEALLEKYTIRDLFGPDRAGSPSDTVEASKLGSLTTAPHKLLAR